MDINLGLSALATGSVDVITATYSPAVTLDDKKKLWLISAGPNASTAPTFSPNSVVAHIIKARGGQALRAGDTGGAGYVMSLMYQTSGTYWELLNPATVSKSDVGLSNVDNTNDANKPVSVAQALADLAAIASANGYTDSEIAALTFQIILANGNDTGPNDIIVGSGQKIRRADGTFVIDFGDGTYFDISGYGLGIYSEASYAEIYGADLRLNFADVKFPNNNASKIAVFDGNKSLKSGTISEAQIATISYVDGLVAGLLDDRGSWDVTATLQYPNTGGSGPAGAIMKGDIWFISGGPGTIGGIPVVNGDSVRALVDAPGQLALNWNILETNLTYTPENVDNKDTDVSLAADSDLKYASQKAVKAYIDAAKAYAIARDNHTGTQTAATISDFNAAALAAAPAETAATVGAIVNGAADYVTPLDADKIGVWDSLNSLFKAVTYANWKAAIVSYLSSFTMIFTNKNIQKRGVAITQAAIPAFNIDNFDIGRITGLAQAITSMTTNMTGTPFNGQMILFEITDNGTARAITWGVNFTASGTIALPTTTVISTMLNVLFKYNGTTSKFEVMAVV